MTEHEHDRLVRNLLLTFGGDAELIQTHISSVILAGDRAYKLKKPVDFGFLDYASLARRRKFCEDEVQINGRYAPQLYLGVVPVTGSVDAPRIGGEGEAVEYAVAMRRFDQQARLDVIVEKEGLSDARCDAVADAVAAMHAAAEAVAAESDFGSPERVVAPMLENFDLMASLHTDGPLTEAVEKVRSWTAAEHARLTPMLQRRKAEGHIRECHGDMHLHNMALLDDEIVLFDAIEFNPYLNHIDVISDLAFLLMDLEYRGMVRQSRRLLNRYLEHTGDYAAVALLPFYKTYRAMVRAKVLALHAAQEIGEAERVETETAIRRYVALAASYREEGRPFLAIMHGFSGSGKSTVALKIVEAMGALRLRSDIERMRMYGANPEGRYGPEATEATYAKLATLAGMVLEGGSSVIADATFLQVSYRERFASLAEKIGVPFVILDIVCDEAVMLERLRQRRERENDVSEADEAVLRLQQASAEPLLDSEAVNVLRIGCEAAAPEAKLDYFLRAL